MTDDDAIKLLKSTPAWAEFDANNAAAQRALDAYKQLAALDDTSLRRVVERYVAEENAAHGGLGVPAASRLYVLVRYVYAAPSRAPAGKPRFGAFQGIPYTAEWVDEMWPLTAASDGTLQLTGKFGGYAGDDYLAVQELDAFRQRYGRRKVP